MIRLVQSFGCALILLLSVSQLSRAESNALTLFSSDPASIYGSAALYEVFRNDKPVGRHRVEFSTTDDELEVRVESDLEVRYLGMTFYRYAYVATEKWKAGKLISVESVIRDNRKKPKTIAAWHENRLLHIASKGKERTAPRVRFPSNHWHPGVLTEKRVYHTLHARVHSVKIRAEANETIRLPLNIGSKEYREVTATKYRYQGGFEAEVWYDEKQRWVRLLFKADDGSLIDYRCVSCTGQ